MYGYFFARRFDASSSRINVALLPMADAVRWTVSSNTLSLSDRAGAQVGYGWA
jgi:hypothetical protein